MQTSTCNIPHPQLHSHRGGRRIAAAEGCRSASLLRRAAPVRAGRGSAGSARQGQSADAVAQYGRRRPEGLGVWIAGRWLARVCDPRRRVRPPDGRGGRKVTPIERLAEASFAASKANASTWPGEPVTLQLLPSADRSRGPRRDDGARRGDARCRMGSDGRGVLGWRRRRHQLSRMACAMLQRQSWRTPASEPRCSKRGFGRRTMAHPEESEICPRQLSSMTPCDETGRTYLLRAGPVIGRSVSACEASPAVTGVEVDAKTLFAVRTEKTGSSEPVQPLKAIKVRRGGKVLTIPAADGRAVMAPHDILLEVICNTSSMGKPLQ